MSTNLKKHFFCKFKKIVIIPKKHKFIKIKKIKKGVWLGEGGCIRWPGQRGAGVVEFRSAAGGCMRWPGQAGVFKKTQRAIWVIQILNFVLYFLKATKLNHG